MQTDARSLRSTRVPVGSGGLQLVRIPLQGGTPITVTAEAGMTGVAIGSNCLFWSSFRGISAMSLSAADVSGGVRQ